MTKAMLLVDGIWLKNFSNASSPPAEAPIPTMRTPCASAGAAYSVGMRGVSPEGFFITLRPSVFRGARANLGVLNYRLFHDTIIIRSEWTVWISSAQLTTVEKPSLS
jgi:hypothetical protein